MSNAISVNTKIVHMVHHFKFCLVVKFDGMIYDGWFVGAKCSHGVVFFLNCFEIVYTYIQVKTFDSFLLLYVMFFGLLLQSNINI